MPFLKLDVGILDSSLWLDRDVRSLFITALCMAEPYQLVRPADALDTEYMSPTGFVVPPGNYGFIRASGGAIIRQDGCDRELGRKALRALSEPDPDSRSKEFEGRRMVRVDGGYIVLNYWRYRMKDHTAAERMRRMRERDREDADARALRVTPRNVTHSASASASAFDSSNSEDQQNPLGREDLGAVLAQVRDGSMGPELAELIELDTAGMLAGFLRRTREAMPVLAVLNRHLTGMNVPVRSPAEVYRALVDYLATSPERFNPNYFAGFLRKGPESDQRVRGARAQEREAEYIDGEQRAARTREEEDAEALDLLGCFADAQPERYQALLVEAEARVPTQGPMREAVVSGLLLNLVKREIAHASAD